MADINFLSVGSESVPLGKIFNWDDSKASLIVPISFPGGDAGKTEAIDTLGVIAYINLSGRWVGKFENIQSYIIQIKNIQDGLQSAPTIIRSPFVNSVDSDVAIKRGMISSNTSVSASKLIDSTANFSDWNTSTSDKVKNLRTGNVSTISSIDSNIQLTLDTDIFPVSGEPYALTGSIGVKVLSLDAKWSLPGMSFCDYTLSLIQVNEEGLE